MITGVSKMSTSIVLASLMAWPSSVESAAAGITLKFTSTPGSFDVLVDGRTWLPAGKATAFRLNGRSFSASDGTLKLKKQTTTGGSDTIGAFSRTSWEWSAGQVAFETAARVYTSKKVVTFEQKFLDGASGTSVHDVNGLISTFPSFALPVVGQSGAPALGLERQR